jgi:hypothetical protein
MPDTLTPRRLVVTRRDLHMLHSLCEARYLTAQAIEWLHVPGWWKRWQAWQAAQSVDADHARPYTPSTNVYSRLRRLEAVELIRRVEPPITLAISTYRRDPFLYALTPRGAELLAEYGGVDQARLCCAPQRRNGGERGLAHSGDLGRVYAALRARIEAVPGWGFAEWQIDGQDNPVYDRSARERAAADAGAIRPALPIQPNATFRLIHPAGETRCFVELDLGRAVTTWRDKLVAYQAYASSPALAAQYRVTDFTVLCIAGTNVQRQKLMQATAEALAQPSSAYLFGLLEDTHPARIGSAWLKIARVLTTQPAQTQMETAQHVFIH